MGCYAPPPFVRGLNRSRANRVGDESCIYLLMYFFAKIKFKVSHSLSRVDGQVKEAMDQKDNGGKLTYNLTSPAADCLLLTAAVAD